jgi:hypothetical protein
MAIYSCGMHCSSISTFNHPEIIFFGSCVASEFYSKFEKPDNAGFGGNVLDFVVE